MPELPEVETVKNGLIPHMTGKTILNLDLRREGLRTPFTPHMAKRVKGRVVKRLERRAKYILIHMDDGHMLALHLGMSGRVTIHSALKGFKPEKHDHVIFQLSCGGGVVFSDPRRFGSLFLITEEEYLTHHAFKNIGPEPLSNAFSGPVLFQKLSGKRAAIKIALLDQHVVAGIGNIYASEALHRAEISPHKESGSLTEKEAEKLAAAIRTVLQKAIAAGGSTLKDYRQSDGSLGYFQHGFSVYDREGHPCPSCRPGDKKKYIVQKTIQAGRATYFCPFCQK